MINGKSSADSRPGGAAHTAGIALTIRDAPAMRAPRSWSWLASVLASLEPTAEVSRQLTTLMTMVTLQSVTDALETELASTEFVVLPIFGQDGQPEYQIEIHLGRSVWSVGLTLGELDAALRHAQGLLTALP